MQERSSARGAGSSSRALLLAPRAFAPRLDASARLGEHALDEVGDRASRSRAGSGRRRSRCRRCAAGASRARRSRAESRASWASSRGRLSRPARSISTSFRRSSERTSRTWSTGSASQQRQRFAAVRRCLEERAVRASGAGLAARPARSGRGSRSRSSRPVDERPARPPRRLPTSPFRDIAFASAQPCAGASASSASTDHSPGARSRPTAATIAEAYPVRRR